MDVEIVIKSNQKISKECLERIYKLTWREIMAEASANVEAPRPSREEGIER